MLPEGRAKGSLEIAIDRAAEAITEGRDAVQALRHSKGSSDDLVQTLTSWSGTRDRSGRYRTGCCAGHVPGFSRRQASASSRGTARRSLSNRE
jgi:hypothetical protein